MADLRLTVGAAVDEKVSAPNARAVLELAAFARKLGAAPDETGAQQAQRILRHFARQVRDGAHQQLAIEAEIAAQNAFEAANPRPEEWA